MSNIKRHAVARAPYRISLGGGGTDLTFYAKEKGGFLISAAIDEYISVMVAHRKLDNDIFIQYSDVERVRNVNDIKHNIIREVLKYFKISHAFQVSTFSTMPTFTGLGASSTLIVALIKSIRELLNEKISETKLAEEAYYIEREVLNLSGGFQDQYISSLGGVKIIKIDKKLNVECKNLDLRKDVIEELEQKLILIHSKVDRRSDKIIDSQIDEFQKNEKQIIEIYDKIKNIGKNSVECIKNKDWSNLGKLMDDHWKIKKRLSDGISSSSIDEMYLELKSFGSQGGKIIGAGGGGFFLMVVDKDVDNFKKKAEKKDYKLVDYKIDFNGAHSLY